MPGLNTNELKQLEELVREKVLQLKQKNAIPVTQNTDMLVKHLVRVLEKVPGLTPALLKTKEKELDNVVMFAATLASNPLINAHNDPRLLERLTAKFAFLTLTPTPLPPQLKLQMLKQLFTEVNETEPNPKERLDDAKVEQLAQATLNIRPEENEYLTGDQKVQIQSSGADQFFQEVFLAITFKNPNSAYFEGNDSERPSASPFAAKTPFNTKLTPPGGAQG